MSKTEGKETGCTYRLSLILVKDLTNGSYTNPGELSFCIDIAVYFPLSFYGRMFSN